MSTNHITVGKLTEVDAEEDEVRSGPSCDSCTPDVSAMQLSVDSLLPACINYCAYGLRSSSTKAVQHKT